jgi:hypothetical protein
MTFERSVRPQVCTNQQVTWRASVRVGFTLPLQANDHTVIHAWRNPHLERMANKLKPVPWAARTRRFDRLAAPMATRTGRQRHHPHPLTGLDVLLLPGSSALRARLRLRARLAATPCPGRAFLGVGDLNFSVASLGSLFQGEIRVVLALQDDRGLPAALLRRARSACSFQH